jgi:DNA-directed RNA polymerase alpha subunit
MSNSTTLAELDPARCPLAMSQEDAETLAKRIALHLYRGSIEAARDALENGWKSHLADHAELPEGPALLDEPLSRVVSNLRTLNMLEEDGILTIGQLLNARDYELRAIPNMGMKNIAYLANICDGLRVKAGLASV